MRNPAHAQEADTSLPPDGFVDRWTPARKEAVLLALDLWLQTYRRKGRNGLMDRELPKQGRLL